MAPQQLYRMELPELLFRDHAHLLKAMEDTASSLGESPTDARKLFLLLPDELRGSPAAISLFDNAWHYAFGEPYQDLPNDTVVVGTGQMPSVERLYRTLRAVQRHCGADVQHDLFEKLGQRKKHQHFLDELLLLQWIPEGTTVEKDVKLQPEQSGRDVDFLFSHRDWPPFAVEVKHRVKDLIQHVSAFVENEQAGNPTANIAAPAPGFLFRSVVEKFPECSSESRMQGVWIFAHIQQVETDLLAHFQMLDAQRLHFAVLSDDNRNGYILARSDDIKSLVRNFFCLTPSTQHVC